MKLQICMDISRYTAGDCFKCFVTFSLSINDGLTANRKITSILLFMFVQNNYIYEEKQLYMYLRYLYNKHRVQTSEIQYSVFRRTNIIRYNFNIETIKSSYTLLVLHYCGNCSAPGLLAPHNIM